MTATEGSALPDGWTTTTLGEAAEYLNGRAFKSTEWGTHGLPIIRIQNLNDPNGSFNYTDRELESRYKVETGDLLFAWSASLGAYIWRNGPAWLNQHIFRVDPKPFVDRFYLFYFLNNIVADLYSQAHGSGMVHITKKKFNAIPIIVPPLKEQRRIVAKIEELFSELDNGVASLKAARAHLKIYGQALLKAAFEGRLTEQWRRDNADSLETADEILDRIREERMARYQQQLKEWESAVANWEADGKRDRKPRKPNAPKTVSEVSDPMEGVLPADWGMIRIADVADVGTGVTPLKKRTDFYEGGTVPWVTSGAVNEPYVREPSGYVTETALNENNLRLYPKGTLLVAMYGEGKTRGKASELAIDATTNQALAAISCHGGRAGIQPYLKWFLIHNYEEIRRYSSGGVQPNLNLGIVENTAFPLCSFEEQREIVNRLEVSFSRIREMERTIESTLIRSEALRQSILKRAFEGKLVPHDPDDEPASVLLERIRAEQEEAPKPRGRRRTANA